jgi:hypothetical protein
VANGDLSQTMAPEVDGRPLKGEFLRVVKLVNAMVRRVEVVVLYSSSCLSDASAYSPKTVYLHR